MSILDRIQADTHELVARRKQEVPVRELEQQMEQLEEEGEEPGAEEE